MFPVLGRLQGYGLRRLIPVNKPLLLVLRLLAASTVMRGLVHCVQDSSWTRRLSADVLFFAAACCPLQAADFCRRAIFLWQLLRGAAVHACPYGASASNFHGDP